MNRYLILSVFIALSIGSQGQNTPANLVPNGSFEQNTGCPFNGGGISFIPPWLPVHGSPDYFHACGIPDYSVPENFCGVQEPFMDGDSAYIGVSTFTTWLEGGQESIYVNLSEPLVSGAKYRVKMNVSPADYFNYVTCCIGVIFDNFPPPFPPVTTNLSDVELVIDTNVIDTDTWYEMDEIYTAQGGETKMYIGNFRPDDESQAIYVGGHSSEIAYMFIDNVSVSLDTSITMIGGNGLPAAGLKVIPNPATAKIRIIADLNNGQSAQIDLMNYLGHRMQTVSLSNGITEVDVSSLSSGVYHYSIVIDGVVKQTGKQVILR